MGDKFTSARLASRARQLGQDTLAGVRAARRSVKRIGMGSKKQLFDNIGSQLQYNRAMDQLTRDWLRLNGS